MEGQIPQEHKWGREQRNYKSGHVCIKKAASIDLTPLTAFQASGGIKGNHSDETGGHVGIRSRCPLRSLPLTMHHKQCWLDFWRSRQAEELATRHSRRTYGRLTQNWAEQCNFKIFIWYNQENILNQTTDQAAPPTSVQWLLALRLNRDSSLKIICLVGNTSACRDRQKSNQHCLWCMVSGRLLNGHRLLMPASASLIRMVSFDITRWLEGCKRFQIDASCVFSADVATLKIVKISLSFIFKKSPGPLHWSILPSVIHSWYHSSSLWEFLNKNEEYFH